MKKILILTAGFGEGHNAAARGVRDGLARVAPDEAKVELRDLLAETYPVWFKMTGAAYLGLVNHAPRAWGLMYQWLDRKKDFDKEFQKFDRLKQSLAGVLDRFRPDVVVSVFPPYPYVLDQILGSARTCKSVAIVTDSITVNKIWYHSAADYFLLPNEQSAAILRDAGIAEERIKTFGFPVSPNFADLQQDRQPPSAESGGRVLYMINAGTWRAPRLVKKLLDLEIDLTVTVGRNQNLRYAVEAASRGRKIDIVGWTKEMPRLLGESHLLIGKAGGATVQETIAAACPMIINHIVSGQEEGNAQLIEQTNSGVIALSHDEVVAQVQGAFADDAKQWRDWARKICKLSRPRASLDIAEFVMSL